MPPALWYKPKTTVLGHKDDYHFLPILMKCNRKGKIEVKYDGFGFWYKRLRAICVALVCVWNSLFCCCLEPALLKYHLVFGGFGSQWSLYLPVIEWREQSSWFLKHCTLSFCLLSFSCVFIRGGDFSDT